jgi:hypothetical protein
MPRVLDALQASFVESDAAIRSIKLAAKTLLNEDQPNEDSDWRQGKPATEESKTEREPKYDEKQ